MLTHTYQELPARFFSETHPDAAPDPTLLAWNQPLASELGLGHVGDAEDRAALFSGAKALPGAAPIAMAYAGHQFGQLVPQLGDGRAALLGEVVTADGQRYDIQLKGSGRTDFSRGGDGKSSLGPVIREYLVSEAMHRLGVPTTRALAAVATGEDVLRDRILPGGVLTRVAASHIRVGTFQYFAIRGDTDGVQALADYAIARHYPAAATASAPYQAFFSNVVQRQAELVAHWMAVGFIHGVMNTDNTSIAGETIDYGPCAFLDEYQATKVFSSIDRGGRYAYNHQAVIAEWNLARLAECLLSIDDQQSAYTEMLADFEKLFTRNYVQNMRKKLALDAANPAEDAALIKSFLAELERTEADYTLSFRDLASRLQNDEPVVLGDVESRWRERVTRGGEDRNAIAAAMNRANPIVIPRNHHIERAITAAIGGDFSVFNELQSALAEPYVLQSGLEAYADPPQPDERVRRTFCGT